MRYLNLLIIFLFITLDAQSQVLRPSSDVSHYITNSTQQLNSKLFKGPEFQQPIVYIEFSPLHIQVAGLTREIGPSIFIIDLNPAYDFNTLEWVLMHELVHVYQISSGILDKNIDGFIWKGLQYPYSTPYKTRPWELHAEAMVREICK